VLLVYEAENLIDGQLALDELRAGGLHAVMKGHYLSGAVGELPTSGLVTVWITEPRHEQRALDLIADYERDKRREQPPQQCSNCGEQIEGNFGRCWNCSAWLDRD
jgi:lipopolysaccharide biosynthesis regulator YciM